MQKLAEICVRRPVFATVIILALVGITCSIGTSRLQLVAAATAGMVAVAAFAWPLRLNIVIAIGAAVAICLMLERLRPRAALAEDGSRP